MIRRALLSVSDKTGIVDFARTLRERGVEIISTGGTRKLLASEGIEATDISSVTGFPEMLDGRVKTLHPNVHGGLLGLLDDESHTATMKEHGIESIDLLVVNLYPFEETVAREDASDREIIEQIDIGGPAMIRSAAKNWRFTAVVVDPRDYVRVIERLGESLELDDDFRRELAGKAFERTASYDRAISDYFGAASAETEGTGSSGLSVRFTDGRDLRYGENPHQSARVYGSVDEVFDHIHGKELSYNNFIDLSAAALLAAEFEENAVVIVKHTNPCGVGVGDTQLEAWERAFATDTKSPFGGIIAVNRELDVELAAALNEIFTEVIVAPSFSAESLDLLRKKKQRRLIRLDQDRLRETMSDPQFRTVPGGLLAQDYDAELLGEEGMKVVTRREPSDEEWKALTFAWKVAKHVKSNAIVYAAGDRTLGIGAGQMSRVDSAMTAARKAGEAGLDLEGCAVASDAFFPFADGLLEAVEAGATAAIQPGGSIRDNEVIEAADEKGIAMVMTGMRHFRH